MSQNNNRCLTIYLSEDQPTFPALIHFCCHAMEYAWNAETELIYMNLRIPCARAPPPPESDPPTFDKLTFFNTKGT